MCFAVIEIKYNLEKEPPKLKKIETKELLTKELAQLEQIGTVESVTIYHNHHKHKLVKKWEDELYKEPVAEAEVAPVVHVVKV
jgi:hypothetical protein